MMKTSIRMALVAILLGGILATDSVAQETGTHGVITACYVPGPGLLYRTGMDGASTDCRSAGDIPLAWNAAVDLATIQVLVAPACPAGAGIRQVAADGSVTCEPDDDSAAGFDFGSLQTRVAAGCADGEAIRLVRENGVVECHSDQTPAVSSLQVRVLSACPEGASLRRIDDAGNIECHADGASAFSLTAEYAVSRGDRNGISTVGMGSSGGSACFLTRVEFEDIDSSTNNFDIAVHDETAACEARVANGQWELRAILEDSEDANAWCSARCITWQNAGS